MGCGSCGKSRKQIKIRRDYPKLTGQNSTGIKSVKQCPSCKSPMRSIHKYDKSTRKVIRSWYCTKPSCPNSKG